jgi:uncharacterized protein
MELPMISPITIRYAVRPRRRSLATGQVADLFGLAGEEPPHVVAENVTLDVRPGDLVLFTGPSGSGKSSLLREVGRQLSALDANALDLPDAPLVDALPGSVAERLDALAACGLSEARLLLRTPGELSDGQRYRFRLALAIARAEQGGFVLADEFCAVLDRRLAKVLAFNVCKLCSRTRTGFLLATTHDDLLADLNPDITVRCLGDGAIEFERRQVKKKRSVSRTSFGCRTAPAATGRTSLGGITAVTTSPSSAESFCSGTAARRSASAYSRRRRRASDSVRDSSACDGRYRRPTSRR